MKINNFKKKELKKSVKDDQFMNDLKETIKDFEKSDLEEWPDE